MSFLCLSVVCRRTVPISDKQEYDTPYKEQSVLTGTPDYQLH